MNHLRLPSIVLLIAMHPSVAIPETVSDLPAIRLQEVPSAAIQRDQYDVDTIDFGSLDERIRRLYGHDAPRDIVVEVIGRDGTSTTLKAASSKLSRAPVGTVQVPVSSAPGIAKRVALGVILIEERGTVVIDTKPCESRLVAFTEPYSKTPMGQINCGTPTFERFQVVQK